jgi:hypothetical protein
MALFYQVNSHREERPKFKKKFLDDLPYSEPLAVKHNPPKNLTPDGKHGHGADDHDFPVFSGGIPNSYLSASRVITLRPSQFGANSGANFDSAL